MIINKTKQPTAPPEPGSAEGKLLQTATRDRLLRRAVKPTKKPQDKRAYIWRGRFSCERGKRVFPCGVVLRPPSQRQSKQRQLHAHASEERSPRPLRLDPAEYFPRDSLPRGSGHSPRARHAALTHLLKTSRLISPEQRFSF